MEHNGDIYSCDHFVEPKYLLGNILEKELASLASSERQHSFGSNKKDSLPMKCLECDVYFACHGECPKNRFLKTVTGELGLNYLCEGWKAFFHHINYPMQIMVALMLRGYPASEVMRVLSWERAAQERALSKIGRRALSLR
jgi:uncharacterized protein